MKKRLNQRIALLLCVILLAMSLSGCGEKGKVEKLMKQFESACQEGDMDRILDCVDPSVAGPTRTVTSLVGAGVNTLTQLLPVVSDVDLSWLGDISGDAVKGTLSSFHVKPTAFSFSDAKDRCTVLVTYSASVMGSERSVEGKIHCIERDGKWYITF